MEEPNNYNNFDEEYKESINYDVKNGSYFKEAFKWYCDTFLRTITDRTFYVFMSIMGILITYNVIQIIFMILPLKEDIFITIKEKDLTKYFTRIYDLSKNEEALTTDEDILRYLIINYVVERESHNYKTGNINDVNTKLEKIRNNSSGDVYNEFNMFMSSGNINGPFYYFGKNVETTVQINSFNFIRIHRTRFIDKIKDYFNLQLLPVQAEVYYTLRTQIGNNITSERRKAVVSFKFRGTEYNEEKQEYSPVVFQVTGYKNYKLN